jgi:hypothetical protein
MERTAALQRARLGRTRAWPVGTMPRWLGGSRRTGTKALDPKLPTKTLWNGLPPFGVRGSGHGVPGWWEAHRDAWAALAGPGRCAWRDG